MNNLRVIAITHQQFPLETVGVFYIKPENRKDVLKSLKESAGLKEVMYVATCNRVELVFTLEHFVCPGLTARILHSLRPDLGEEEVRRIAHQCDRYNGPEALEHLLRVASSLESAVIGEREIITQIRTSYEECSAAGLTGDDLRLVVRQCIKTAKEIFTHTELSRRPVSVVSLAWHEFLGHGYAKDARILLIGAGQIVRNFCKFLGENGYHNLTIANRTPERAELLARSFGGRGIALSDLPAYKDGFDVLLSCTGSDNVLITEELYNTLLTGEKTTKLVIDLAIPPDVDSSISRSHSVRLIDMEAIQTVASFNMQFREKALEDCEPLIESGVKEFERAFHEREVERAMRAIPETIKEIKATALGSVFARDLEQLDENSRELLEKILGYMEKKYISVPMKMAKEVLLDAVSRN